MQGRALRYHAGRGARRRERRRLQLLAGSGCERVEDRQAAHGALDLQRLLLVHEAPPAGLLSRGLRVRLRLLD